MTRADLIDRLIRAVREAKLPPIDCVCQDCQSENIRVHFPVGGSFVRALIDELDRDGLEIVKK